MYKLNICMYFFNKYILCQDSKDPEGENLSNEPFIVILTLFALHTYNFLKAMNSNDNCEIIF